eukprot:gene47233-43264_t
MLKKRAQPKSVLGGDTELGMSRKMTAAEAAPKSPAEGPPLEGLMTSASQLASAPLP